MLSHSWALVECPYHQRSRAHFVLLILSYPLLIYISKKPGLINLVCIPYKNFNWICNRKVRRKNKLKQKTYQFLEKPISLKEVGDNKNSKKWYIFNNGFIEIFVKIKCFFLLKDLAKLSSYRVSDVLFQCVRSFLQYFTIFCSIVLKNVLYIVIEVWRKLKETTFSKALHLFQSRPELLSRL